VSHLGHGVVDWTLSSLGTKCNNVTQQTVTFSPYIALLTLRDGKHKIQSYQVCCDSVKSDAE